MTAATTAIENFTVEQAGKDQREAVNGSVVSFLPEVRIEEGVPHR